MSTFEGSSNKALVRSQWDLPIIEQWMRKLGASSLSYFGLPGPAISDLLDWQQCLGYCTGVERLRKAAGQRKEDLNTHRLILKNIMLNGIGNFQLLRGQIEDVILDGTDLDNTRPHLSKGPSPLIAPFHYDLVNLDFLGGMGYKDKKGESKRVRALKKLLERQRGKSFLLILTLNVRDGIDDELIRYLDGAKHGASDQALRDTLSWYIACAQGMKDYRLKAVVPLFIRREAEVWGFDCFCYPPLVYEGSGSARMVHFAFQLLDTLTILHAYSTQEVLDVINLPFIEIKKETLEIAKQHPNFDFRCCESQLGFLPDKTRIALLATVPEEQFGASK